MPERICEAASHFDIMGGKQNCFSVVVGQAVKQGHQLQLARIVEEGGWLVEEKQIGALGEGFGDECFLLFSVAEGVNLAGGQMAYADLLQRSVGSSIIEAGGASENAGIGETSVADEIADAGMPESRPGGQNHADEAGNLLPGKRRQRAVVDKNFAGEGRLQADKGTQ